MCLSGLLMKLMLRYQLPSRKKEVSAYGILCSYALSDKRLHCNTS